MSGSEDNKSKYVIKSEGQGPKYKSASQKRIRVDPTRIPLDLHSRSLYK